MLLRYLLPKVDSVEEIKTITERLKKISFCLSVVALGLANYFMPIAAFIGLLVALIGLGVCMKLYVTLEIMVSSGEQIKKHLDESGALIIAPSKESDENA